jgi:3-oxoacyl-[acyl-carrier-protein] synthase-1
MTGLYLHGRSLISALGDDLREAAATLATGGVKPASVALPGGTEWPFFRIDDPEPSWRQRARALVRAAIAQAGVGERREAPLFIATSSFQVGAIETHESTRLDDYYCFAEEIAAWLDWRGPVQLVSTACTSSLHALLAAAAHLRAGAADEAVVLGVELANRFTLAGFAAMQLLSPKAPLPLGIRRDGLVLGEAVAVLHLSRQPSRWRLRGGASLVDGRDPTGARPDTVAQLCREALADSGLPAEAVDLVKVQAAGSPFNDSNEVAGLAEVFAPLPPLVSLKATIGHTLGASGAAEIALLLECLERGVWPSIDYPLDPEAGAGLARARPAQVRQLLALILGFGGGYSAVALEDRHG